MSRRTLAMALLFTLLACARALPPISGPPTPPDAPDPREETTPASAHGDVADPAAERVGSAGTTLPAAGESAGPTKRNPAAPLPVVPMVIPDRVRVGLATDLAEIVIPCCSAELTVSGGAHRIPVRGATRVEPGSPPTSRPIYRLQVAALRAEAQAAALSTRLSELLDGPGEVVFDARDGLYRVRLGRYETRPEAERGAALLSRHGVKDAWVISEQTAAANPVLKVTQRDRQWIVGGRWIRISAAAGDPNGVPINGRRYRGELLIYLNGRGRLNLINRVTLDDYLRGVVPREMGPELYGDLEALKAQAVAARTYTLRNLDEFGAEGYDICATPRCQVYGGIGSEHALSDRAVSETLGEVLLTRGRFADALYSSTCGGHTENVEVVFPLKRHSYLRGVPCLEAGTARLDGVAASPASIEAAVLERVLPEAATGDALGRFTHRARRLAALAGVGSPGSRPPAPGSLDRRELHVFLAALLELESTGAPAREADLAALARRHADWDAEELRLTARLLRSGLVENRLSEPLGEAELRRTLFRMAIYLRLIERTEGRFLSLAEGELRLKRWDGGDRWLVPADAATYRVTAGAARADGLALVPGDMVSIYAADRRVLALVQYGEAGEPAPGRPSRGRSWQHFRTDRDLERMVESRYPGLGFRHLEVISRGVSGRVAAMRLTGRDGQQVEVTGLPIRWTLDLPDTLFTARKTASRSGEPGWLFSGRGWGHGVGMCQVGAFGMAQRGHGYRDILDHYYTGLELKKLPVGADRSQPAP